MTGFAFAYAVMRVCGGQPRKNPGAVKSLERGNMLVAIMFVFQLACAKRC